MMGNLEEALKKRFPGEHARPIAEILSIATEKGSVVYDELDMREDVKDDLLLLLEKERLLIPVRTSRALAWEDRMMIFRRGEVFEMPNVIGHLMRYVEKTREWDPDHAMRRYLEEIGEKAPEEILSLFNKVKKDARDYRITPEAILRASEELNLTAEMGRIIAELKGGGIISPCLRDPSRLLYEVNPSLVRREIADGSMNASRRP
jgi:hypothetical protein